MKPYYAGLGIILFYTSLVTSQEIVSSYRCFRCASTAGRNSDCEDPFQGGRYGQNNEADCQYGCMKTRVETGSWTEGEWIPAVITYTRGCAPTQTAIGCRETETNYLTTIRTETCYCREDVCNAASRLNAYTSFFLVSLILLVRYI